MNPIHQFIQKILPRNHFSTNIKGHNSDNNQWILLLIKLDLYFMIIYLCVKYESNLQLYSKNIFFVPSSRAITVIKKWWILSVIKLDLYFMIIYLCMKNESNTSLYSKDIARKPFFIRKSRAITLIIISGFYP